MSKLLTPATRGIVKLPTPARPERMRTVEVGAERSGQEWISPVSIPHDMNRTYQFILGRNAGGRFRRFALSRALVAT